jgi:large repetitive protein
MHCGRIALAVTAAVALFAVSSASGEDIDGYTAAGAPAYVKPATQATFTIALTNKPLSPREADKAKIGIPADFVVTAATVQATASAAGACVASTWVADGTLIADGKINLKRPGGGDNNRLCPGATLTVVFAATSSAVEGTYIWATQLLRGADTFVLTGNQPSVQVDGTAPVVTITSNPGNPTNATSAMFEFAANEPASFECRLDSGSFADCTSPKSYTTANGTHTFRVRGTDAAGNVGGVTTYTWTVDTVPPTTTISSSSKPPNPTNTTSANFVFSASEQASFQCTLDGGPAADCTSPTNYGGLADGSHTFSVRATDAAGNTGPAATHTWTVDTIAPTATITNRPNDPSGVKSATFEFSASEAASFKCDLDGGGFAACSSPKTYSNLTDGIHTFKVKATDAAGNTGPEASYDWLVETDLPVVTLTATPPKSSNSSAATFFFTANKSATFECKLDEGAFVPCASPQPYSGLADGPHTFAVRGNGTGGTGPATIYTWTIDTTGPTTAITQKPADPTNSRSATFAFGASEPATFQCKLDDAAFASCSSPQAYGNLGDGRHTFVVKATDALLNTGSETAYGWTIEMRPPAVAVTSAPRALSNSRIASFSFTADEPSTFQCSLDGRGFEPCGPPASYGGLSDGAHGFAVRATDAAGNVGAASHAWTIDATPPQTTLDAKPRAITTATSATLAFSASEPATFQCRLDGRSFSPCSSPKKYTGLAKGLHRFAVRATDAAGNVDATPSLSQWTVGRSVTRTVASSALFAPAAGARVTRPPLLRWRTVRRASYYNVQLYRAGRKVLTAWPTRPRLQLRARWKFNGKVQRLGPGVYRWYVWPGYGRASARRYGRMLGTSTFIVARAAARR